MTGLNCLHAEHAAKGLEPVPQLLHLGLQSRANAFGGLLQAGLDAPGCAFDGLLGGLRLGPQQIIQGGDLGLGVVAHLAEVWAEPGPHVLHVVGGAGLQVLEVVSSLSGGQWKMRRKDGELDWKRQCVCVFVCEWSHRSYYKICLMQEIGK